MSFEYISYLQLWWPSCLVEQNQNCLNGSVPPKKKPKNDFKQHFLNHLTMLKLIIVSKNASHNALYKNCVNGSDLPNKIATGSIDKKYL